MAPTDRWSLSDTKKFLIAALIVVGVFVVCYGTGLSNVAVGGLGMAIAVLGPGFILFTTMRGNAREYVYGTAHVHEISPLPSSGSVGRCELELLVTARGINGVAVRVRDAAVPINKWPDVGATLPVVVAAADPRKVRILWDEVRTHGEVAYDDHVYDRYTEDPFPRDRFQRDREPADSETYEHGPYPPDQGTRLMRSARPSGSTATYTSAAASATATVAPPVPGAREPLDQDLPNQDLLQRDLLERDLLEREPLGPPPPVLPPSAYAMPEAGTATNGTAAPNAPAHDATHDATTHDDTAHGDVVDDWFDDWGADQTTTDPAAADQTTADQTTYVPAAGQPYAGEPIIIGPVTPQTNGPRYIELEFVAPASWPLRSQAAAEPPAMPPPFVPPPTAPPEHAADPAADPADELEPEPLTEGAVAQFLAAGPRRASQPLRTVNGVSVTLIVADLGRSLRFYRDTLGLVEIDSGSGSVVLATGDARVVLRRVADMPPVDRRVVHLNLEVPDVYEAYERLRDQGVEFVHRPRMVAQGEQLELCSATFRDPDGHAIALTRWEIRR